MNITTSSEIACKALHLATNGSIIADDVCDCAYCGSVIEKASSCHPFKMTPGFNDSNDLANRSSKFICVYCEALTKANILRYAGKVTLTETAAFSMTKYKQIASVILNPPEPPFVLCYAERKQQHVIWRSQVNLSREYFHIQMGTRRIPVRRQLILKAIDNFNRAVDCMKDMGIKPGHSGPFSILDITLQKTNHGEFRYDVLKRRSESTKLEQAITFLKTLRASDLWALAICILEPVELEPFDLKKL